MNQEISPFDLEGQQEARTVKDDAARQELQVEVDDLKFVMGHKQGRRFVWRQLASYGVFRSSFDTDSLLMAFREGGRNQGLKLIADIHQHCPERYAEMMKESIDHGKRNSSRNTRDSSAGS